VGRGAVVAIVIVCFTACSVGCSWTATIARSDGPDTEGEIHHSDAGAVYVRARNGGIYRIDRSVITDIDHPGNVEMVVGGILVGLFSFVAISERNAPDRNDALTVLAIYGGLGLALISWGLARWVTSFRAARAFEAAELPAGPAPRPGAPVYPPPPSLLTLPPPPPPAPPPPPPPDHDEEPQVIPDATSPP
jgi:hypothetical protein